jgi:hypothetical protein
MRAGKVLFGIVGVVLLVVVGLFAVFKLRGSSAATTLPTGKPPAQLPAAQAQPTDKGAQRIAAVGSLVQGFGSAAASVGLKLG